MKRVLQAIIVVVLFTASEASSFAAPASLITTYGDSFALNGKTFSFVGVNIRGITHYGHGDPLPYTSSGHIDENLDGAVAMGCKVIRLFAAVNNASNQEVANRLEVVLDKMENRGLSAIVCFTDLYTTPFHPQGDDGYYQPQSSGWTLLDDTWFAGGYREHYLPLVETIVGQLKDHSAVFAWEIGNELTDVKNPNNMLPFVASVASTIKSLDPFHLVTTGFISVDHTQVGEANGYTLYADPNIDFMTVHSYTGEDPYANRAVHSRLRKPLLLGEFGWDNGHGNRVNNTQDQMEKWYTNRAVHGFMNWGYQAQAWDIGDGDNNFGIDRYAHSDYDAVTTLFLERAQQLAADSQPLPTRLRPDGVNVARQSVAWRADSIYNAASEGDKAFDGVMSEGSKWTSLGGPNPHWLALDLGRVCAVNGFTVRMSGDAGEFVDFNFKSYEIQSGASLNGPWTTEFSVTNPAQLGSVHSLYSTQKSLRYLRILVTNTGIDLYARLPEFEVYEQHTGGCFFEAY